jgi:hypothetical protein
MKTKVAYYSGTGGAERVALCFAERLAAQGCDADDWACIDKLAPGPLYAGIRRYLREARPLIPKEPPP